jgi:ketosteroid isomerase-like protein
MSQENLDLVRAAFEEISRLMFAATANPQRSMRNDYARVVDRFLDPDFELVQAPSAVERRTLHGFDGFVTFMEGGREIWSEARLEPDEFIDAGDEQVVALAALRTRGRASGAEVEQVNGTVWTLREAKVARIQTFLDPGEALAAVGLPERDASR